MKDDDVTTTQDKNNSDSNEKIDMEQMKKLIPIKYDEQGRRVVDGRQLYEGLKISKGVEYTGWIKDQLKSVRAEEGVDYVKLILGKIGGVVAHYYQITFDTAKKIAMVAGAVSRNKETQEISNKVMDYFIWCEKQFSSLPNNARTERKPSYMIENPAERARAWADEYEEKMKVVEERNKLIHHGKLYTTTEVAKELNLRSPQQLNKYLESKKVQYEINGTWVLYSEYSESNYVSTKQQIDSDTGKISYSRKWTGEGRDFILNLWKCERPKTKRLFEVEDNKIESNINQSCIEFSHLESNSSEKHLEEKRKEFEKRYKKGQEVNKKSIVGVHVKTGEVVRFDSVQEAANALGTSQQNITNCLRGASKSAKGYKWYYAKDYNGEVK